MHLSPSPLPPSTESIHKPASHCVALHLHLRLRLRLYQLGIFVCLLGFEEALDVLTITAKKVHQSIDNRKSSLSRPFVVLIFVLIHTFFVPFLEAAVTFFVGGCSGRKGLTGCSITDVEKEAGSLITSPCAYGNRGRGFEHKS